MAERELPLFPLNVVLFPGMRLPLHIFEERYKLMIGTCMVTDQTFGVALIQSGSEVGGPAEIYPVGTTARIVEIDRLPEGRMNLVAVGVNRFRVVEWLEGEPYAMGRVELLPDRAASVPEGLAERVEQKFRLYLQSRGMSEAQAKAVRLPAEPLALSYFVAAILKAPARQRQLMLEDESVAARLRRELAILEWSIGGPAEPNARAFSLN
jgi:Lon protease-like protein